MSPEERDTMLGRIDERTKFMHEDMKEMREDQEQIVTRTSKLENFRAWVIGIGAGVTGHIAALGTLNLLGK